MVGKGGSGRQDVPSRAGRCRRDFVAGWLYTRAHPSDLDPFWMRDMDLNSLDLPKRPEDTRVVGTPRGARRSTARMRARSSRSKRCRQTHAERPRPPLMPALQTSTGSGNISAGSQALSSKQKGLAG